MTNAFTAAHQNLRTLCLIRLIALIGLCLVGIYLGQQGDILLPWGDLMALMVILALLIGVTWWRSFTQLAISNGEMLSHLVTDVVLITLVLFYSGGASNPFVSYYLVPITISAITLPRPLTGLVAILGLTAYTALLFWHLPVPELSPMEAGVMDHAQHNSHMPSTGSAINLHILGMWINFVVSALLIAYFVTRMAATIRQQQQDINLRREQALEDEQLLAVATLAASAAHELGTPLNSVKLIADDWKTAAHDNDINAATEDMALIAQQVARCQQTLKKLGQTARANAIGESGSTSAALYFEEVIQQWLLMRPEIRLNYHIQGQPTDACIEVFPTLAASIHNLLNNAGDASPERVQVDISWDRHQASLAIRDYGAASRQDQLQGRSPINSEKPLGMGLGLFLTRRILNRHGATLLLQPHDKGGTLALVTLPLKASHNNAVAEEKNTDPL